MGYKKYLRELRSKLVNNQMSVMVGAGFSKNVSPMFPSWAELLKDLLKDSYGSTLEREYLLLPSELRKETSQEGYFSQRCKEILADKGYLQVVSDYIKSRSVESITTYIEARTPHVSFDSGHVVLKMGDQTEKLDMSVLELHRMIVGLQWNNIYTTNYDHLLDICVNDNQAAELKAGIALLGEEINGIHEECDLVRSDIAALDEKITMFQAEVAVLDGRGNYLPDTISSQKHSAARDAIHLERNELNKRLTMCLQQIELKQSQMEKKEQAVNACFNIVKNATKLRIKRNKNIIKLHGTLRTPQEIADFEFGFDGDNRKQYVISGEDYRDYPQKHEAFTQLMRISLLQESFCLVGFSADDPNFIAWVGWVRDILQKMPPKGEPRPTKIYLIDVGGGDISVDRQLFLENYSIKRIPLQDPEIKELLQQSCELDKELSSYWDYLFAFLSYLSDDEQAEPAIPVADLTHIDEWRDIWKDRTSSYSEAKQNMEKIRSNLDRLAKLTGKIHIAEIKYTHQQFSLLNFYVIRGKMRNEQLIDPEVMPLLGIAAKDTMLPLGYFFSPAQIVQLESQKQTWDLMKDWHMLELIAGGQDIKGLGASERAYQLAFSFRFSGLREHLESWDARGGDLLKKAGLLSFLSVEDGLEFLTSTLSTQGELDNELRLYLTEQRTFTRLSHNWRTDKKLFRIIEALKRQGLHSLSDNFSYILDELKPPLDQPRALGNGRFSVGRGEENFEARAQMNAIRFLFLLMESGFHMSLNRTVRVSVGEWYKVIHNGFEFYPAAFLFYGLQYSDDNYLKRLGQEYGNSQRITEQMRNQLTIDIFGGLDGFRSGYRDNAYIFLSTFLNAVDPSVWEASFMKRWGLGISDGFAFAESHLNAFGKMAFTAFKYLTKGENIVLIIANALKAVHEKGSDIVISYMYNLLSNNNYKTLDRQQLDFSDVDLQINELIDLSDEKHLDRLFSLTNVRDILSPDQSLKLRVKIAAMDFALVHDSRFWNVASFLIADNHDACKRLKEAILKNGHLWHTGKNEGVESNRTIWSSSEPIELSRLTKSDRSAGVEWTKEEIDTIYQALLVRISELDEIMGFRDTLFDYVDLLEEIEWFLCRFSDEIKDKPGYLELSKKADVFEFWMKQYHSIPEGLISRDHANVVWALSEVGTKFYQGTVELSYIYSVINKVLFQVSPALEAAISHLASWIQHNVSKGIALWDAGPLLISILKKYKDEPLTNGDPAFVSLKLIGIAFDLRSAGLSDDSIQFWLSQGESSRYNQVKQLFHRKLIFDLGDNELEY